MRRPVVFLVGAGVVTVAAVVGGVLVLGGDDGSPAPAETPFTTTPLAGYDTSGVAVERGAFCDRIDPRQVKAVLGSAPDAQEWTNGDKVDVAGTGQPDVVHEFGCRYAVQDAGMAQAWVFAPPVGADRAARLVKDAEKTKRCEVGSGPPFGSPTLALTCTDKDGTTRASYRGLFGDAWLVCEVERPAGATWDVTDRAGRWCVGVLEAARAEP